MEDIDDPIYRLYRKKYVRKDDAEYFYKQDYLRTLSPEALLKHVKKMRIKKRNPRYEKNSR